MNILGIDPGSINCGYGIVKAVNPKRYGLSSQGNKNLAYIASGRIVLPSKKPIYARLKDLYISLLEVISEYKPDEVVIERIFFAKGTKAALSLGQTRGVALLAASSAECPIYEYSALEVKKAVVGYGMADKNQVQKMVKQILRLNRVLSSDSADALAIAICHANNKAVI